MEFDDPIVGTTELIRAAIQSPNYQAGVAGWIIRKDGTAEFQDLIARGSLTATELDINNTAFGGNDRGRLRAFFDEPNLNQQVEWHIGQQNIDDFITGGAPSGALQTDPAEIRHEVRGTEGPELELNSGEFNSQGAANISIFGKSWDGASESGIALTPSPGGSVSINNDASLLSTRMRVRKNTLESDSGRSVINDTTYGADFDCAITMSRPGSGILIVNLWMEPRTTAGTGGGLLSYEIRDTDSAGTVRLAASDARAIYSIQGETGFHSTGGQFTEEIAGTSDDIYIRLMFKVTSVTTTVNFARCRLEAQASP